MAIPMTVQGRLVAVMLPRAYSFKNDDGQLVEGVSRQAALSAAFTEQPIVCKFPDEVGHLHTEMLAMEFGAELEVRGEVRGNNLRVLSVRRLDAA